MRIALAFPEPRETTSLGRETILIAEILRQAGGDVHLYQRPGSTLRAGVAQHSIGDAEASGAASVARWARSATAQLRRDRERYDVVCAVGTAAWEHDLVRVHAVIRAEQERWPTRGGRNFRAARLRARLAPVLQPQVGVERSIQRLQFRTGRFERALAVTEEVAADLERDLAVDPSRIEVIPCLIDHDRFAAVVSSYSDGRPSDNLLFVGNDFARKGLAAAIRGLAFAPRELRLVVVGGGDPARYRRLAEELGVLDRVDFAGATDSPEQFYEDALALVAPTAEDVWGMAQVEAMAAGVPVVSSDAAGVASFVARAGAGIVVDGPDPQSLARAIERLVDDRALAASMGEAGRKAVVSFHRVTVEALVRAFEAHQRGAD